MAGMIPPGRGAVNGRARLLFRQKPVYCSHPSPEEENPMIFTYDALQVIGFVLRALGAIVFGLGAGWLVVHALKSEAHNWQLAIAAILGLLGTFALVGHWVEGGATLGGFGLGAGAGILLWGMGAGRKSEDDSGQMTRRK
jgi:hypothetical protein